MEVLTVHPGIGVVLTEPSGWSSGRVTWSLVVLASSRSLGTRKATTEKPPASAAAGWMVTWAWATPGRDTAAAKAAATPTPMRRTVRRAEMLVVNMMRSRFVEEGLGNAGPVRDAAGTSTSGVSGDRTRARFRRRAAVVDRGGRPRGRSTSPAGPGSRSPSPETEPVA